MTMHNPPHPGEFVKETYLLPFDVSQNEVADRLKVARSTFNRLVRGHSNVTLEMAMRLAKVLGRSPESWLVMQSRYDLHALSKQRQWGALKPFVFGSLRLKRS